MKKREKKAGVKNSHIRLFVSTRTHTPHIMPRLAIASILVLALACASSQRPVDAPSALGTRITPDARYKPLM